MTEQPTPTAPPGWYPSSNGRRERLWDGEEWTEYERPVRPTFSYGMLLLTLVAAFVVCALGYWFVHEMVTADDQLDCAHENVQRSLDGLPPLDCPTGY